MKEALEYCSYVRLPGLGSFSVRPIGSQADGEKGDLTAPRMVYGFSAQRQFEDDALVNHLINYYETDEQSARQLVQEFVSALKERLEKGDKIAFAGIGTLSQEGNDVVYTADALPFDSLLHTPNYSLKPIRNAKSSKGAKKGANARVWILSIIAILLLTGAGLGGYYLYHRYRDRLFASRVEPTPQEQSHSRQAHPSDSSALPEDKAETIAVIDSVHTQENALRVANHPKPNAKPETAAKPESNNDGQLWYIVVGGYFSKHEGAVYVKEERRHDGYDARIQAYKNGWRVIIGKYTTYPDALRAKNIFCAKKGNPDAAYVPKQAVRLTNLE